MVFEEVLEEVAADNLSAAVALAAQRPGDEVQIFFQRVRAVGSFQPIAQAGDDVIFQILFVGDGKDIICVYRVGKIFPLTIHRYLIISCWLYRQSFSIC